MAPLVTTPIRRVAEERLRRALARSPVVALVGPRQCGKTTLARRLVSAEAPNYFDLEDPVSLARLDHLKLDALRVVYPGTTAYRIGDRIAAVPAREPLRPFGTNRG